MFLKNEDALLSVYSEWASIVGEAMLSGIPTKIPARAAARSKDATRQRRRSLRYGSKDNDIPAGELLLADIVSGAAEIHSSHADLFACARRSSSPRPALANTFFFSKVLTSCCYSS
jgi:hypothetical protein